MVISKTNGDVNSAVSLSGFTLGASAAVYCYSAANLKAIVRQADQAVVANRLMTSFLGESITLLVIPGTSDNPGTPTQPKRVFLPVVRN